MAYEVKVSTGDVAAKAATITREAHDIEARLAQLTSQMGQLAHTWTGAAASSFQTLYADWDRTARQMKQALDSIGLSLKGAGHHYDELEAQLTRAFA
jgi:WXG100 family type VII secretion target